MSSQSSHHPQEVLLAQFSLHVHKGGLKPSHSLGHNEYDPYERLPTIRIWDNFLRTTQGGCKKEMLPSLLKFVIRSRNRYETPKVNPIIVVGFTVDRYKNTLRATYGEKYYKVSFRRRRLFRCLRD